LRRRIERDLELLVWQRADEISEQAAGAVVAPSIATSAGTNLRMPISRFVAVSASPSEVVSIRMLLRMGRVVRLEMAPGHNLQGLTQHRRPCK